MSPERFRDRADAAARLAEALEDYRGTRPLVIGVPRGGVPLARRVADALDGELDVVLVRKLGAPESPELAIGAVDEEGRVTLNPSFPPGTLDPDYLRQEVAAQRARIRARRARYTPARGALDPAGRTVLVVDDGAATGSTLLAALGALRLAHPALLVAAVPVAPPSTAARLRAACDRLVVLRTPEPFYAVGAHYLDFGQVDDEEVIAALAEG
ncbi:MAG: phosphoribosyltransferase family protein [Planctomycetota bacterium]